MIAKANPDVYLRIVLLLCVQLLVPAASHAQSQNSPNTLRLDGADPAPAQIEDLAWLAGYWRGTGLGGDCEELWSEPLAGRMLGSFALVREGKLVFSEAMTLVEEDGSVVLKIRHYDADFVGWEDKDDYVRFRLVKTGKNEAWFSGLTFRKTDADKLQIFLVLHSGDESTEHRFDFERIDL